MHTQGGWLIRQLLVSVVFLFGLLSPHLKPAAHDFLNLKSLSTSDSISLLNRFQDVSFKTVFQPQPTKSDPLNNILHGFVEKPTLSVLMHTSLWSGRVKGEGEIADSRPSGPGTPDSGTSLQYRLIRFGLTGVQARFTYGVSYRVAGEGFAVLQDQAFKEIWSEWNMGVVRVRTALTEHWDNVDKDPRRPRISGTQEKATLAIASQAWPEMTITYARNSAWSSFEPIGVEPQRNLTDSVEAALSYARPKWQARLFSIYSVSSDRLRVEGETIGITHAVSGSYRANHVTIAPTLSMRADQQRWSGARLETPSASLSLTYVPSTAFKMAAFGSYSRTRSSAGLVDSSMSTLTSVFTWVYCHTPKLRTTVSIDATYTALLDGVQPFRSTEDLSGLVRLQLAGL
jgi:hypothetical protein